jgi:hypothetical protein
MESHETGDNKTDSRCFGLFLCGGEHRENKFSCKVRFYNRFAKKNAKIIFVSVRTSGQAPTKLAPVTPAGAFFLPLYTQNLFSQAFFRCGESIFSCRNGGGLNRRQKSKDGI